MKRLPRLLQFVFGILFGGNGLILLLGGLFKAVPAMATAGFMLVAFTAMLVLLLERQIRSLDRTATSVRRNVEFIAKSLFDQPAVVEEGYDLSVTMAPDIAARVAAFESPGGQTATGTYGGVGVAMASHVSAVGRQPLEIHHVYSYVLVDTAGADVRFTLTNQSTVGKLFNNVSRAKEDATVGDAEFDKTWMIDCTLPIAKAVYTESVRKKLMELKSRVREVSNDVANGAMSLMLSKHGLALRWPGELPPELAVYVRDLLLEMRTNLLAQLDQQARAQGTTGTSTRVAADLDPMQNQPDEVEVAAGPRDAAVGGRDER